MYLVEIYLPVATNRTARSATNDANFSAVRSELTEKFGGVTAFIRAPASGLWEDPRGRVQQDDIVTLEVITEVLDRTWWRQYRLKLEKRFHQEAIVVHASEIELL